MNNDILNLDVLIIILVILLPLVLIYKMSKDYFYKEEKSSFKIKLPKDIQEKAESEKYIKELPTKSNFPWE